MAETKPSRKVVEYPPKHKDKSAHQTIYIYWAVPEDVPHLIEIERSASELFRHIGMDSVAYDEPPSEIHLIKDSISNRILLASEDPSLESSPVAYLSMELDEDHKTVYLAQVSVDYRYARKGIGERLIDHLEAYAHRKGYETIVLTTFKDVPWNGPYYQRLGFYELDAEQLKRPEHGTVSDHLDAEKENDRINKWSRVAMRKDL
ncbi:acyl-CoA N-acyltransferase [Eremomyces bilateralis CBS 781.70]|uniref:Acyl-CoA N-acyltransferase n=1 Tax=Eremomyces bilateralis CBS 781.70 TaxID=1392243 RepID=A0A6G1FVM8_9PEZI|nr:acyl-CoA N-acyltransferase [Eremomyces bilateralis CBS 781.70]KAF1809955.1 acyl-CoA N-acyltransferase [Eremomyces bilateralis CBS 781.70]